MPCKSETEKLFLTIELYKRMFGSRSNYKHLLFKIVKFYVYDILNE